MPLYKSAAPPPTNAPPAAAFQKLLLRRFLKSINVKYSQKLWLTSPMVQSILGLLNLHFQRLKLLDCRDWPKLDKVKVEEAKEDEIILEWLG